MARKRTPTNEGSSQSHKRTEKISRLKSNISSSYKEHPITQSDSSWRAQRLGLTLAFVLTTLTTAGICYSLYPQLTSVSSSTRKAAPSLRQIVDTEGHSYLSKRETDLKIIDSAVQLNKDSEVSQVLNKAAHLSEAEDEEVAKLAQQIVEIKTRSMEKSKNAKASALRETFDVAPFQAMRNSLQLRISNDLKSQKIFDDLENIRDKEKSAVDESDDINEKHFNKIKQNFVEISNLKNENPKEVKPFSKDKDSSTIPVREAGKTKSIILTAKNQHITLGSQDRLYVFDPQQVDEGSLNDVSKQSEKRNKKKYSRYTKSELPSKKDKTPTFQENAEHRPSPSSSNSEDQKKMNIKTSTSTEKKKDFSNRTVSSEKMPVTQAEDRTYEPSFQRTFVPKKTFYGGRRIAPLELLNQKPSNSSVKVYLFDDFLSQQECEGLIAAHNSHVEAFTKPPILCFDSLYTLQKHIRDAGKNIKVTSKIFTHGTSCVNSSFSLQLQNWLNGNWSYSTAFYPGESKFSTNVATRLQQAMGLKPENGGKFQITSYPLGKAYKTHTDCTPGSLDKRDRVVSVLMYLNDAEEGGETKFPDLGIWVKPKRGRAIVWNNMSPQGECELESRHVASLVKKGKKYILIRWYYYKSFLGLGQRPTPPGLPMRDPDQAKVSCDDYDNGSCRWYDEWTHEHLMEYQRTKLNIS